MSDSKNPSGESRSRPVTLDKQIILMEQASNY